MSQTFRPLADEDILEAYFSNVQRSQTLYVVMLNTEGTIVMVNRGLARLFGKVPDEFTGTSWFDIAIPNGDRQRMREEFKRILATGLPDVYENPISLPDGTARSVLWSNSLTHDGDRLTGTLSIGIDITERHEKERLLTVSELSYRRLFEAAQDGILIINAETGMILDVNPYLINLLGYSKEDFLNKYLWDVGLFRDIAASKDNFETLKKKGFVRFEDLPLETKSGSKVEVEFVANAYQVDHTTIMQCNIRNITDRVIAQDALALTAKQLLHAEQAAGLGTYVLDVRSGRWTSSAMMDLIFGIGPDNPRTVESWASLVHPDDRAEMVAYFRNEVLGKKQPFDHIYRTIRANDGKTRWVHGYGSLALDAHGEVMTMSGAIRDITDAREQELALREAEGKYHTIFDKASVCIARIGINKTFLDVNPAFESFLGYSAQELRTKSITDVTYPEDANVCMDEMGRIAMGEQEVAVVEMRYVRKDGSITWGRTSINLLRKPDGSPDFFLSFIRDITESRDALERLKLANERFLLAARNTFALVYDWDMHNNLLSWEGSIKDLTGYSPNEFPANTIEGWEQLIHPEDRPKALDALEKARTAGAPYLAQYRLRKKDGSYLTVDDAGSFITDATGASNRMIGVMRDVTATARANARLQETELLLSTIINGTPDPVYVKDLRGRYLYFNKGAELITGKTAAEIIGHDDTFLFAADEARIVMEGDRKVMDSGKVMTYEERVTNAAGIVVTFRSIKGPIHDTQGNVTGLFGIAHDISSLREDSAQFVNLIEHSPIGISIVQDNAFAYLNAEGMRMMGATTQSQVIGKSIFDFEEADFHEGARKRIRTATEEGKVSEPILVRMHRLDGTSYDAEVRNSPVIFKGRQSVLSIVRNVTDAVRAQRALAESEAKYRQLIEGSSDIPFAINLEGTIEYMGPQAVRYGLGTDFAGKSISEFVHPDDRARALADLKHSVQTGKGALTQFRILDASGGIHWLEELSSIRRDTQGSPTGFVGILRDITERINAQNVIQSQKQTLDSLLSGMSEGFAEHEIILDESGKPVDYRFLSMNSSFERLTGLRAADLLGKTCREALPSTEQVWIDRYGEVAITGKPASFTSYSKEAKKSFRVNAWRTKPNHFAVIFSDVTEETNELATIGAILDNTLDTIAVITPTGTCTYQNAAVKEALGYDPKELIGQNLLKLVNPLDLPAVTAQIAKGMVSPGKGFPATYRFKHKDGSWHWLESVGINLLSDQRVNGILISSRDVTDVKRSQETLVRVDELEAMNKAMVGRELRISELKAEVQRLTDALARERLTK